MRRTGLFALYGVTVAAVIVAAVLSNSGGTAATDPLVNRPVLPGLSHQLDTVARLTVVHGDTTTTMLHQKGVWVVEQENDYPADQSKIKRMLLGLAALRYAEPKTAKANLYSRLDVEDAGKKGSDSRLITLSDGKGQLMEELIVGKRRYDIFGGGTDGIYVRKPGEAQSWLASGSLELPSGTLDWVNRQITMIPPSQVKSVHFISPDGATVQISRKDKDAPFTLAGGIPKGKKLKTSDTLMELARGLNYFSLDDVKPATALPFPAKETSRAIYTTFDGLTITVSMVEHDQVTKDDTGKTTVTKKYWVKLYAAGTGKAAKEAADLNRKVAAWTYAVPDFKADTFKTRTPDLFAPEKSS